MDNLTRSALADGIYVAFTDGSCKGNPGPGGAAMLLYVPDGDPIERTLQSLETTNNKAEMAAVIVALKATPEGASVLMCLDSEYIKKGFESYLTGWINRRWRKSNGDRVKNQDLWGEIIDLTATRKVTFHKIKGHSGHPDNERVDALAGEAAEKAAKRATGRKNT